MNLNAERNTQGSLNFLIIDYLKGLNIQNKEKDEIIQKLQKSLSYGSIYDINLNSIQSNFELTKQTYTKLNPNNLPQILFHFLKQNQNEESLNFKTEIPQIKCLSQKQDEIVNFHTIKNSKFNKNRFSALNQHQILSNFSHMKSILGHISLAENTIITPVPIYVIAYSLDDKKIITGGNNGTIKIWSSITGQLIESFKAHDKPINDLIVINEDYFASCSEDQTVVIWNINTLLPDKIYNFDESLIQLSHYKFSYKNKKKFIIELNKEIPKDDDENHNIIIISSLSGNIYLIDLDYEKNNDFRDNELFPIKFYFDKKVIEKFELKKNKQLLISSIASNSKCGLLVSGFNDGLLCVWDMKYILEESILNEKFIYGFEKFILFLDYVHSSLVNFIEFNSKSNYFLTGSVDGSILIWSIKDQVIQEIRANIKLSNHQKILKTPIYSEFRIVEDEDRTRCSVNVAFWTKKSSYVIAIISSKKRKKALQNRNAALNNANQSGTNPQGENNESEYSNKRSSSLIVYCKKTNSIIRKYNNDNGFNFDDECFVCEAHPIIEDIILTISGINQIVVFNFITGQTIKSFKETNYFFTNVSQNIIACEGKFSNKGDSFVIATFFGFISIYSIYPDNSFSTTYMNQFISNEFSNEIFSENLNTIFPNYVNMYNLPHIVDPPHSKYKLNTILEKKESLKHRFGLSEREIERRYLVNNLESYLKNFNDRKIECEKEVQKYEQSELDNMNYRIPDENDPDLPEEEEVLSDHSYDDSYHSEEDRDQIMEEDEKDEFGSDFDAEQEMEGLLSESNDLNDLDFPRSQGNSNNRTYNLRNKGTNSNSANSVRNSRYNLRRDLNNENDEEFRIHSFGRPKRNNNSKRGRKRLRLRGTANRSLLSSNSRNQNSTYSLRENINKQIIDDDIDEEYIKSLDIINKKNKHKKKIINDDSDFNDAEENSNTNEIQNEDEFNEIYNQLKRELIQNEQQAHECYFCKYSSDKLFGPFYLKPGENKVIDKITPNMSEEYFEIYIDIKCLYVQNDFAQIENRKLMKTKTIEKILSENKRCFRCLGFGATKKCTSDNCCRYFHGNNCTEKYCIDYSHNVHTESTLTLCLECYKTELGKNLNTHPTLSMIEQIDMNTIPKNFFLREKNSFNCFFPQKGERVYFILPAYENFLKNNNEYILFEISNEKDIFFWKNIPEEKNCNILYSPFLCQIEELSYEFLNKKTLKCLAYYSNNKNEFLSKIKIIIRMKLFIIPLEEYIEVIFFENDQPDFMIKESIYNQTKEFYLKNICKSQDLSQSKVKMLIDDSIFYYKIINISSKERNTIYKNSNYESICVKNITEQGENTEEEVMNVSFWELYNENYKFEGEKNLGILQQNFLYHFKNITSKKKHEISPFENAVDEIKDGAKGYYNLVPVPMYLNLIKERLTNFYYLSYESLKFDLNLMLQNSIIFNRENSLLVQNCKNLINKLYPALDSEMENLKTLEDTPQINSDKDKVIGKKRKRIEKELGFNLEELKENEYSLGRCLRNRTSDKKIADEFDSAPDDNSDIKKNIRNQKSNVKKEKYYLRNTQEETDEKTQKFAKDFD